MIHLHRLIKQLSKLIETNSVTNEVAAKDEEIIQACKRLVEEHGNNSDVSNRINLIFMAANRMNRTTRGGMGMGHSGAFDYELAMRDVQSMEKHIREIGEILNIEFKET